MMIRKFLIGALAATGLMAAAGEMKQADARPRVRFYSSPYGTTVRWGGGGYSNRYYRDSDRYYRNSDRYYRRNWRSNISIGVGQPHGWGANSYPYSSGGYVYPSQGYGYPSQGVIYHY